MTRNNAPSFLASIVALLAFGGCGAQSTPAPESSSAVPEQVTVETPLTLAEGQVLLDSDGTRTLIGEVAPAPPNADPPLRMAVHLRIDGQRAAWAFDGALLHSARLHGESGFVVVDADHVLHHLSTRSGEARRLDSDVHGAVGASNNALVYSKGQPPELEVHRYDLKAGADATPRRVTQGMAPSWSPAVSADGQTVVFVSAVSGLPEWYRVDGSNAPRRVHASAAPGRRSESEAPWPFASSLSPTHLHRGAIVFSTPTASYALALGSPNITALSGADGAFVDRAGSLRARRKADGALMALQQPAEAP